MIVKNFKGGNKVYLWYFDLIILIINRKKIIKDKLIKGLWFFFY